MISVRYLVGEEERSGVLHTFCPSCAVEFEPSDEQQQRQVGEAVEVHCPKCGTLALRWLPPPPSPPPEDPITKEEDAAG